MKNCFEVSPSFKSFAQVDDLSVFTTNKQVIIIHSGQLHCMEEYNGGEMGMCVFNKFKTSSLTASIWSPLANCNKYRLVWPWESCRNRSCRINRFMTVSCMFTRPRRRWYFLKSVRHCYTSHRFLISAFPTTSPIVTVSIVSSTKRFVAVAAEMSHTFTPRDCSK